MLVYRLEHPSHGMGPYSRYDGTPDMRVLGEMLCDEHGRDAIDHPSPWDDRLEDFHRKLVYAGYSNAFFACPSSETLKDWFKEFWEWLMELGYQVKVYRVESYKIGKSGKQIAFDITSAKCLDV